jgi:hypothetical protein
MAGAPEWVRPLCFSGLDREGTASREDGEESGNLGVDAE